MKNNVTSFLDDAQHDNTLAAASLASLNGPPTTVADEPTYHQPVAALPTYHQPVAALPAYPPPVAALLAYPQPVAPLQWPAESELAELPDVDVDVYASSIYTEYI